MPEARAVFQLVDSRDAHALVEMMAEDATMVFGNGEPLHGRDAILAANDAFMSTVQGVRHSIRNEWTVDDATIADTEVTYTRLDGKEVTIPVVSIWRVRDDGLINDYRVFLDLAPVFAP